MVSGDQIALLDFAQVTLRGSPENAVPGVALLLELELEVELVIARFDVDGLARFVDGGATPPDPALAGGFGS